MRRIVRQKNKEKALKRAHKLSLELARERRRAEKQSK